MAAQKEEIDAYSLKSVQDNNFLPVFINEKDAEEKKAKKLRYRALETRRDKALKDKGPKSQYELAVCAIELLVDILKIDEWISGFEIKLVQHMQLSFYCGIIEALKKKMNNLYIEGDYKTHFLVSLTKENASVEKCKHNERYFVLDTIGQLFVVNNLKSNMVIKLNESLALEVASERNFSLPPAICFDSAPAMLAQFSATNALTAAISAQYKQTDTVLNKLPTLSSS